jgi:DNA repair exonuclease SbcCD nuclease subunit
MTSQPQPSRPASHEFDHSVRLVHTSDVHIGLDVDRGDVDGNRPHALSFLERLFDQARKIEADLVVIVGDFFDHNRLAEPLVADVAGVLAGTSLPVVILPGNHDPYTDQSIYARFASQFPSNVHVLTSNDGQLLTLPQIGIQLWGQAHTAYEDFSPAGATPTWMTDGETPYWRVALAHGSTVDADGRVVFGYRIESHELEALEAHYIALGHLERPGRVNPMSTHAYYSGSPKVAGGYTLADLTPDGVSVQRMTLTDVESPSAVLPTGVDVIPRRERTL